MKKFKKIYIEITNICNLSCSFCSKSNKKKEVMSVESFEEALKKIDKYTDYIYLHVKGEPLLHKDLKDILYIAKKYNKFVNITTNGTLINNLDKNLFKEGLVRQINFSLHSENSKENYLEDIFSFSKEIYTYTNIVYRFWTLNDLKLDQKSKEIIDKISIEYSLSPEMVDNIKIKKSIKIYDNIYIDKANKFTWPDSNNDFVNDSGYCYALKDQIAILVDGTIVPCCLDGEGEINLGNIFNENLEDVLSTERVDKMIKGFRNRKVEENLCKHCNFKNKF